MLDKECYTNVTDVYRQALNKKLWEKSAKLLFCFNMSFFQDGIPLFLTYYIQYSTWTYYFDILFQYE